MKKTLLLLLIALSFHSFSQIPDGSIAPDWTLMDINGKTYHLYDYLNRGKVVIINFSTASSGLSWDYHNTFTLDSVYSKYGPLGSIDTNMMIFFIEGDSTTTLANLQGQGGNSITAGDWVTGTKFPIFNPSNPECALILSSYGITNYPTIYMICPDRIINEIGTANVDTIRALSLRECAPLTNHTSDVKLLKLNNPKQSSLCISNIIPNFDIQNYAKDTLKSFDVTVVINGETKPIYHWTGSLPKYSITNVDFPEISALTDTTYNIIVYLSNPNGTVDENKANDTIKSMFSVNAIANEQISINVLTDEYPTETSWILMKGINIIAQSSGYNIKNTQYSEPQCLKHGECYTLNVYDTFGDGFPGGNLEVKRGTTIILSIPGDSLSSSISANFCVYNVGIEEKELKQLKIFPNPAYDLVSIENAEDAIIQIYNMFGQLVYSKNKITAFEKVNISNLCQGTYLIRLINENEVISSKLIVK